MRPPDLLRALGPVAEALEAIGVGWYVGGSLASSARGVARSSLERQWTDVLGVLSASRDLDLAYLARHAEGLSVGDLLARALSEADRGGGGQGAPASV